MMNQQEREKLEKDIKEANEIYEYIEKNKLNQQWMGDTERFMGFTYLATKDLIKHSVVLTRLTRWLIGLTIGLGAIAIGQLLYLIFG